MKRIGIFIFTFLILLLAGEMCSSPKEIVSQNDNVNHWMVHHFFNMCNTEYIGPMNDTAIVVLTNKTKTKRSAMVNVSDGTKVTLIRSQEVYDNVEIGDTFKLVTTYTPVGSNKYRMKYIVIK